MSTANKAARRGSGRSGSATVASPPQVATRTVRRLASGPTGYRNGQVKHRASSHTASWMDRGSGTGRAGGLLQTGVFVQGLQDGPWTRHHARGEVLDKGVYAAGRMIGPRDAR